RAARGHLGVAPAQAHLRGHHVRVGDVETAVALGAVGGVGAGCFLRSRAHPGAGREPTHGAHALAEDVALGALGVATGPRDGIAVDRAELFVLPVDGEKTDRARPHAVVVVLAPLHADRRRLQDGTVVGQALVARLAIVGAGLGLGLVAGGSAAAATALEHASLTVGTTALR